MKIWYPFTQHALEQDPIKIVKGKGAILYDDRGNRYLDLISSWWVNMHGHSHPEIARAIAKQARTLEHVIFTNFTHDPALGLAEKLHALVPKRYEYMFFSDNGSTSVEVALKIVLGGATQKKRKILALEGAYHGDTFGSMSVSGRGSFTSKFNNELFEVDFIPFPAPGKEAHSISVLKNLLKNSNRYCAFICEPLIQGAAGMRMYSVEVLEKIIQLLKNKGCTIIFDEVFTGFGRTGKMFAFEYLKPRLHPDLICLSKGITGGFMPLGVTLSTRKYFKTYYSKKREDAFFHGHSYTANPLSCAAAVANLNVFKKEKTLSKIEKIEKIFQDFVKNSVLLEHGFTLHSTGAVLVINPPEEISGSTYFSENTLNLKKIFLKKGLLIRPLGNKVYCVPPYCIQSIKLKRALLQIEEVLSGFYI